MTHSTKVSRSILDTPRKDLIKQQALTYDAQYAKSLSDLRKSAEANYSLLNSYKRNISNERFYPKITFNKTRHNKALYSDKYTFDGRPKSTTRPNSSQSLRNTNQKYTTLPLSKTLIHNKPWSPGKVETNYYSNTRALLSKSANH